MNTFFGEIRTCLVLVLSVMMIVKTRARLIYQSDPIVHCLQAKVPCSGHPTENSCKDYCIANNFADGHCDDSCCLCFSGHFGGTPPVDQRLRHIQRHPYPPPHFGSLRMLSFSMRPPLIPFQTNSHPEEKQTGAIKSKRNGFSGFNQIPLETKDKTNIESDSINEIKTQDLCLTPQCVKSSAALLMNLDENIDPCDDFYQFACGQFEQNAIIPDDKGELTLIGGLTEKLHIQIKTMIEETKRENESARSSILVKNLYDSCMNIGILEAKGVEPLKTILKNVGGWPAVEGESLNNPQKTNWTDLVLSLKNIGISAGFIVTISVDSDVKNSGKRMIKIGEPVLSFGREQLTNPVFMNAYAKYQTDLAVLLGADRNTAQIEMASVLKFERNLANISLPRELARGHPLQFYNPMTITQLQRRFSQINWLHFIKSQLPKELHIDENEVINLAIPQHMANLFRLIEMTDERTLVNYLMWRTVSSLVPYLGESAKMIAMHFNGKITGQLQKPPKSMECPGLVTTTMAHAVGKMYIQKYFNEKSRTEAIKMVKEIQNTFQHVLNEANWMDSFTRNKAHEKANAMKSMIAYPQELLDESKLMGLYNGLELRSDDFLGNVLNITKSATNYTLGKLREPINPTDWVSHGKPAVINAFYNPMQNFIQFPAGILQGHFFSFDRPHYMNFGSIGWVVGHELIHGFDDQGSHFDKNGDLKDWWHPATKQRYQEKTECIVQQYSKYNFTDLVTNTTVHLNGRVSKGENIADISGIKLAYRGYQKWVEKNGAEQRLPGLEKYTPNQMFWISSANNWCSKYRPIAMHHKMKTGVHPPGHFRVLGSLSNSKEFAIDFKCPSESKMNPSEKCSVW